MSGHVKKPGVFEVEFGVTTFRDLIESPLYGGGVRGGKALKAFIPGGASAPWFYEEHLDLPLEPGAVGKAGSMLGSGRRRRDGRGHRRGEGLPPGRAVLRPGVVRQVHAVPRGHRAGSRRSSPASSTGTAARPTSACSLDVCDNISPGITWPPRQTTICPLGPSAVSPIASAVMRFRDEFEAYVGGPIEHPRPRSRAPPTSRLEVTVS